MPGLDIASTQQDLNKAHRIFDPQTVVAKKVWQKTSPENWLKRALIFLMIIWMIVAVLLPVYQLIDRSMHADVLVSIWGNEDVRIGGRRVSIDHETRRLIIDKKTFPLTKMSLPMKA